MLRAVVILFRLLREEVSNQSLLFLVLDAREELRAELRYRLGLVEGKALVHRPALEVAGRAPGLKERPNLRVEVDASRSLGRVRPCGVGRGRPRQQGGG